MRRLRLPTPSSGSPAGRRTRLGALLRRRPFAGVAAITTATVALLAVVGGIAPGDAASPLAGTITTGTFASRAVGTTLHYAVYLPPGYRSSATRYPVVYFLHGLPASPGDYRGIAPIARGVEQAGRRAIVIGVQGATTSDTDPEWLDRGAGHGWETATAKELVAVVDRRYRTIADRSGRILVGISAGGYGATLIALHNPQVYSVVESWSGYFHATDPSGTQPLDLGSAAADAWADAHEQIGTLRTLASAGQHPLRFSFYVGSDDQIFRDENLAFAQELRAAAIPGVRFAVYPGGHSWVLWTAHAKQWLGTALAHAAQPA